MTISCDRIDHPSIGPLAHAGLRKRYAIEEAAWIWHPDDDGSEPFFCEFSLTLRCGEAAEIPLHLSADERYQLFIGDELIDCGPDRSELEGWSFHSYALVLPAGDHELRIRAWAVRERKPWAQVSYRAGFIAASEGAWAELVNTGSAAWQVRALPGIRCFERPVAQRHMIGPEFLLEGSQLAIASVAREPVVVYRHREERYGHRQHAWRLEPSCLPAQRRQLIQGGRVRGVQQGAGEQPFADASDGDAVFWSGLLTGDAITVPARQHVSVLLDFEDYHCGYLQASLLGGTDARLQVQWAESLYEVADVAAVNHRTPKGDRSVIHGKVFTGFGDCIHHHGGRLRYLAPWWRSGRYLLVTITTGTDALTIADLRPLSTHYPVTPSWRFACDDAGLEAAAQLCERGLVMCMHETHVDCPYYEQLNYVGDTRIQMLIAYVMQHDDRLARRTLQLFERSRWSTGLVAERCPSDPYQVSATYSLVWPLMLHDHLLWRDDREFIRSMLVPMRAMLEELVRYEDDNELLCNLPGWSFVDWVRGWDRGMPPGAEFGVSAPVNLQYLLALRAAAAIERSCGDDLLAHRTERRAELLAAAIRDAFWNDERGLFADDLEHRSWSEHSQALALLGEVLIGDDRDRCLKNLLHAPELHRCTVYFSFYLFEALALCGEGSELRRRLNFWCELREQGFTTTVEQPEPSRSDCHAWAAHPLFHLLASLAGVRPAAPGFKRVHIAPSPGGLSRIAGDVPHPQGRIHIELQFSPGLSTGLITLPAGIEGEYVFGEQRVRLHAGLNRIA